MTESSLGVYGTSYKTFFPTTRESTVRDKVFLQTSYPNNKSIRIKTKTTETTIQGMRLGTTQLQSHRNRYQSMQQDQPSKSMSYQESQQYQGCKNIRCAKIISQLQQLREDDQQTIKFLTTEIDKLRKQTTNNTKQIIDEEKYKERLVSATSKVQVQKTLGLFNQCLESSSLMPTSKTDSLIYNRASTSHHKRENLNSISVSVIQNNNGVNVKNAITKLLELYHNSQLSNFCYFSHKENEIQAPYIKCEKCEAIRNEHIIRLECKHQFHLNCLIEDIISQLHKQQESFNLSGQLQCCCRKTITLQFIKHFPHPIFQLLFQIIANLKLYTLLKSHQFLLNGTNSKRGCFMKCVKEHCYFVILCNEEKISYCPLCCEFNIKVWPLRMKNRRNQVQKLPIIIKNYEDSLNQTKGSFLYEHSLSLERSSQANSGNKASTRSATQQPAVKHFLVSSMPSSKNIRYQKSKLNEATFEMKQQTNQLIKEVQQMYQIIVSEKQNKKILMPQIGFTNQKQQEKLTRDIEKDKQKFQSLSSIPERCFACSNSLSSRTVHTNCNHDYHYDCFQQMLEIQVKKGNTYMQCQCKCKIKQNIVLKNTNKVIAYRLFQNQLQKIRAKYFKYFQFDKCINTFCNCFWIKVKQEKKKESILKYCPNCLDKNFEIGIQMEQIYYNYK